ncbi:hypothetical protein CYLTODRAFT_444834 [Cylindrobasidium torrendii FP15055 ss-10]|uniref:Uncharacterized protein n=1 Tax=Cylindrobasidium torrendii FP15055 ss-10 TaxID=1314674 RepID=A0A0D7B9Q8_9AGAR|nr:hypothetical protein CYLTODRAFT_444834 [Cylindrobasidium torrendii FP15055 ss-10]
MQVSFDGALELNQPDTADGRLAYTGGFEMMPTMLEKINYLRGREGSTKMKLPGRKVTRREDGKAQEVCTVHGITMKASKWFIIRRLCATVAGHFESAPKIVHIPLLDHMHPIKSLIMGSFLVARGRLDPRRLEEALLELTSRWPILTSRIEENPKTKFLDLRIPSSISESRPPFVFTSKRSAGPCPHRWSLQEYVHPDIVSIRPDFRDASTPNILDDLLKGKDTPILHVHVNVFDDATCIGFHLPHAFADMLGLGLAVRAWVKLINADDMKATVIPKVIEGDPLVNFGKMQYPSAPEEQAILKANTTMHLYGWWETLRYYFPMAFALFMNKEVSRTLFIPLSLVDALRRETIAGDEKTRWVSENDIVAAILTYLNLLCHSPSSKPLSLTYQANMRGIIPPLSPAGPSDPVFFGNLLCGMRLELGTVSSAKKLSIPEIALALRKSVGSQRTPTWMEHTTTVLREIARRQTMPAYVPAHHQGYNSISWAGAGIGKLSFGAALEPGQTVAGADGSLSYAGGYALKPKQSGRSITHFIQGRTERNETTGEDGGYWCDFGAYASSWKEIEGVLSGLGAKVV